MKWPRLIAVQIGLLVFPFSATAQLQTPAQVEQLKPYLQVKPVVGDENVVRGFFSPACPYSRQYLPFFRNLSKTMPAGKRFVFTPVINRIDGVSFALAFAAVQKFHPGYLTNFIEAAMIGVQERRISTANWAGLDRIGKAARLPESLSQLVDRHRAALQQEVETTLLLQKALAITNTPSISVAGTYIVTPEFTNGDAALYSQLVNGIISMTSF